VQASLTLTTAAPTVAGMAGPAAASSEPIRRFRRWFAEARRSAVPRPEAAALATVDTRGRPSVRYVLLKSVGEDGFVFYTNSRSRKGRELEIHPYASLAIYWDATGRQVRVEGRVRSVSDREADAYWAERPRDSQLASLASRQSKPVGTRAELLAEYRRLSDKYDGQEIPRPPHWTGYRIVPDRIEFWTRREPRLHERELFTRSRGVWRAEILQP
jgi:pyridoxamine 5'-phosphate oxidase